MGLMDIFKAKENQELKIEIEKLNTLLTPEQIKAKSILDYIEELEEKKSNLEKTLMELQGDINTINKEINEKQKSLIVLDEEILMQEFGLYKPLYDFANSDEYKIKLDEIREKQKVLIKNKTAVNFFDGWEVEGSKAKGKKMTNDNIKQILRTFNNECEIVIDKVKFNNIESMRKRIEKSCDSLNKINEISRISLTKSFLNLKLEELNLAYEYQVKKEEEKEEQKLIREELREQAKLKKELEEARKNIDKDFKHFTNALESIILQLENDNISEDKKKALLDKKIEIENKIGEAIVKLKDIDYRQSNQKAGYVYIISNIGAFGENVYKIGMTRRLEPQDRIDELGDASVPFNFDLHAMIFSEDAPAFENSLHKAFEKKKVNMINQRREFFNVTLEEIEEVVKANFDKTVEFKKTAEAEQFRESLKIKEAF
ncbi:DUF4041 domain-containing protein [Clostridium beijerinckii]|nr:DUF4041 domain-containing protein [Clostridium beijerinckii]